MLCLVELPCLETWSVAVVAWIFEHLKEEPL